MKIKLKYILFILIVIFSATVFSNAFFASEKNYIKAELPTATDTFDYTGSYVLSQSIDADKNFCGITIKLMPPVSHSKTLTVTISSPDGDDLVTKTFDSGSDYSSPANITFSNLFGGKAGLYNITITSEGIDSPAPLYYIGGEETATVNGNDTDCSLSFAPVYSNRIAIILFFPFLVGISALILAVYILINSLSLGRENAFIVSVCAFLTIGMLIIPLGAGLQEKNAFPTAYLLSDVSFSEFITEKASETSPHIELPGSFEMLFAQTPSYTSTVNTLRNSKITEEKIKVPAESTAILSPLSHAPASLGITVGNLLSDNPAVIFYFARLFCVLFAVVILFITIKLLPWGKRVFFVICLNPAVISLLCTVSSFGVPLLLSFLLFAMVMNVKNSEESVTPGKIAVLSFVAVLTAISSIITVPAVLLSLVILKKSRYTTTAMYCFALFGSLIIPLILGIGRITVFYLVDAKTMKFISLITTKPGLFFRKLFYEIKETSSETVLAIFGKRVTSGGAVISGGLSSLVIMFLTFIAAVLDRNLKNKFSRSDKLCLLVCGSLGAVVALGGEYIGSNLDLLSPANTLGCYFIPMLLPTLFVLGDNRIIYNTDQNSKRLRDCVYSIGMFPFAFYMFSTVIHYL